MQTMIKCKMCEETENQSEMKAKTKTIMKTHLKQRK